MVYFDHNATTPIDNRVLEAMQPYLASFFGNPSSLYRQGRVVRSAIDMAREQIAALVGVQPAQVIFTSGGTEANNLALMGAGQQSKLAVSAVEHPSVMEPARYLQQLGHLVDLVNVDGNGVINSQAIEQVIAQQPHFVSIMLANNETGVVQDVAGIAAQLKAHGITVHTDAVQALGKIPVSFSQLAVDLMSLSSHKIYGPKGCGALVVAKDVAVQPMLLGGGQEQGYRAGTENVAAIVGFGKAAELVGWELAQRSKHVLSLRMLLERELVAISGAKIFAQCADRLPNTVQFGIEGVDGEMLLMRLDQKGFAVSSGSACASGAVEPSPVLIAMGIDPVEAKTAIRISFGQDNTEAEVLELIQLLKKLIA
ncbi:MAG: cysteine desulfurase family protein [Methylococcales bacterium]